MKRHLAILTLAALVLLLGSVAAGAAETKATFTLGSKAATIAGRAVTMDVPAHLAGGVPHVPLRVVAELWGANVWWDAANRTAHMIGPAGNHLALKVGSTTATILAGGGDPNLPVAVHIANDRVQIPVALLAANFGFSFTYDQATGVITVTYGN